MNIYLRISYAVRVRIKRICIDEFINRANRATEEQLIGLEKATERVEFSGLGILWISLEGIGFFWKYGKQRDKARDRTP